MAEADVVDEDDHHVGGALRRLQFEGRRRRRLAGIDLGNRGRFRLGEGQDGTVDSAGRPIARRRWRGGRLGRLAGGTGQRNSQTASRATA